MGDQFFYIFIFMLLEPDLAVITHKTFNILYLYILTLMNKVVILTDNPKRDLMGNLLLSLELLKKKNIKVFLTPFNLTEKEILNIEPDIIIFNYLRFQNSKLILLAIKKKIKVVVLDTEVHLKTIKILLIPYITKKIMIKIYCIYAGVSFMKVI